MSDPLDRELETWDSPGVTPSIDCAECGEELVADLNGNAPLSFTTRELIDAVEGHVCKRMRGETA